MLGLKLREEFLGDHMPGTAISLRTSDDQGAAQKSPNYILSITYPTVDIQTALKSISSKRSGRPVVVMGDRGRGKSHIMAVMHHAIGSPDIVDSWIQDWGKSLDDADMKSFEMVKGFFPISEPVHNYEYPFLWDLLFDRHPKGEFYRGKFSDMGQPYPPSSLLEEMFTACPTCLILDEFQTWFNGLPEKDPRTGVPTRNWAFNFIQNLSEIAKDHPDILILIISVLNNQNDAFKQVHRQGPVLIDFQNTTKQERQKLLLHRLFENRDNIGMVDIQSLTNNYADERFRLLYPDKSAAEKKNTREEVFQCWPFTPELLELLEDHILLSQAAQETRDMIRILALVYRSRGEQVPFITPGEFFVDDDSDAVQSLVDSIAVQAGQEKLRRIAKRNLEAVQDAGVKVPNKRELISSIWMRSMSPGRQVGGTPLQLHLDITRDQVIDDNAFQAEITLLTENSVNIHGDEVAGGRLWFGLYENPRSKVRAVAKNDKLWDSQAVGTPNQTVYPASDIIHIRKTIRSILDIETRQATSRIIVLGTKWKDDPWSEVEDAHKPNQWDQPVLLVIPEQLGNDSAVLNSTLGSWLVKHVTKRRNTIRFLLLSSEGKDLLNDIEIKYAARCSFLTAPEAWGTDTTYRALHKDFDRPLRNILKTAFTRFAVMRRWDFQQPENCVFDIEKVNKQGGEIPGAVESKLISDLFDQTEFKRFVLNRAKDSELVGDLMDDLAEPPPSNKKEAIHFLGETKIYEAVLDVAAFGNIVLNVNGTWIGRRSEDSTIEEAKIHIKSKAFRTGQEMRKVQLGLPGAVGGGTVVSPGDTVSPPVTSNTTGIPYTPTIGASGAGTTSEGGAENDGKSKVISDPPEDTPPSSRTQQIDEPSTGINLSGSFEKWGIDGSQTIGSATIEFSELSAQQIKRILLAIPSAFKAKLSITYENEEGQ